MKMATFTIIVATIAQLVSAADSPKKRLTQDEIEARKAAAIERRYAMTGGMIVQPNEDPRSLALVNVNNAVDDTLLSTIASNISSSVRIPVIASDKKPQNAGFVVEIKDFDYSATFITAPEDGYAVLNVKKLRTDNPSRKILDRRLTQEIWRVVVLALGGGYDADPRCLMKPFLTTAELDACPSTCPCPMNLSSVAMGAARFGIVPERKVTYKTAVSEGWAPPPTNEVQKAIWDKVHAIPDKPLTIEFDPKKDK